MMLVRRLITNGFVLSRRPVEGPRPVSAIPAVSLVFNIVMMLVRRLITNGFVLSRRPVEGPHPVSAIPAVSLVFNIAVWPIYLFKDEFFTLSEEEEEYLNNSVSSALQCTAPQTIGLGAKYHFPSSKSLTLKYSIPKVNENVDFDVLITNIALFKWPISLIIFK
jgi:hypothetical protein